MYRAQGGRKAKVQDVASILPQSTVGLDFTAAGHFGKRSARLAGSDNEGVCALAPFPSVDHSETTSWAPFN